MTYLRHPMHAQQGAALAISLILLVAMTILGIASLNGARLSEKVSSNAQQKAITFEAAESAISMVFSVDHFMNTLFEIPTDQLDDSDPIVQEVASTTLTSDLDLSNALGGTNIKSVDIETSVSIQYCGETAPVRSSLNADESVNHVVGYLFDVKGNADITGSNAQSQHVQRGMIQLVSTGHSAKCVAPGT